MNRLEMLLQAAEACRMAEDAESVAMAADEGHDLPSTAARYEVEAAQSLQLVSTMFAKEAQAFRISSIDHAAQGDHTAA